MADTEYNLVFAGKIVKGQEVGTVKKKMAALLKRDPKGIEKLFSGETVVIKKKMDRATAEKYQQAFRKIGAVGEIVSTGAEAEQKLQQKAPPPPKPVDGREMIVCPICKYKQRQAEKCIKCGHVLDDSAVRPQASMIPCPKCRYRQKPSEKCIMCGTPMTEEDKPIPGGGEMIARKIPLKEDEVILTNLEFVPGWDIIEHFGLVSGSTIRAKHIGRDIMASLKNLVGGELKSYTKLLQESRDQSIERMKEQARQLGANAVINIRFSTSSLAQGAAELYAYGTAVRIE